MQESIHVPIVICEAEKNISEETKVLLDKDGFENIFLVYDTQELLDFIEALKIAPLIIIGLSDTYTIPSLEATQLIKKLFPQSMIIGSGINFNHKCSISLMALQNGCDSWVEKNKEGYELDVIHKVDHWTKYITERGKLLELYDRVSV
jgi:hypothetical protein